MPRLSKLSGVLAVFFAIVACVAEDEIAVDFQQDRSVAVPACWITEVGSCNCDPELVPGATHYEAALYAAQFCEDDGRACPQGQEWTCGAEEGGVIICICMRPID